MGARARLGDILLEAGEIDAAQLEAALRRQDETGRPLGLTLVSMGVLREEVLVRTLSQQLSLPMARLEGKRVGAEVLELVPYELAQEHRCFPLFVKEEGAARALYLGMDDASDLDAIEALAAATGMAIRPVLVAPSELEAALERQYQGRAAGAPAPRASERPQAVAETAPPDYFDSGDGLDLDRDELPGPDVEFDSRGLEEDGELGGSDLPFDVGPGPDESGDLEADLDAGPGLDLDADSEADLESTPAAARPGAAYLEDSLADFAPQLSVDAPGPAQSLQRSALAAPDSARPEGVSRDAILRALTQLLVEKGLIDREELIARVHRESGG